MSVQGPNQPESRVPLSQLHNMADIDGDGKLRGSELLIFQSACEASGYDGVSIDLYNEDEPLGSFIIGEDTFSTNGKQDAKTYKNSRDEVDDAVGKNSRKTKKEVMAAYQTGASQIAGLIKQVPVDKRSEFIAYLDDLFQTNGPAKYSSAEDCSQVMDTLYKAVQAKIQKDYSTTTGAPSPMPVQSEPDTPLAEVPEVPTQTLDVPTDTRPTLDPSSITKETKAKANETVRSWGEKTNKVPREALGGEFGENNTADKVVDSVLAKMNITNMSDEQKASLRQSVIDANPSVFDKDGNVYANADIKKLDFPTAAAINHVFMGGPAPASASDADAVKSEQNKFKKEEDYTLDDLNEIAQRRNEKNYVEQNDDGTFTMYIYESSGLSRTPFVGSKATIVRILKDMGTNTSVSVKDNKMSTANVEGLYKSSGMQQQEVTYIKTGSIPMFKLEAKIIHKGKNVTISAVSDGSSSGDHAALQQIKNSAKSTYDVEITKFSEASKSTSSATKAPLLQEDAEIARLNTRLKALFGEGSYISKKGDQYLVYTQADGGVDGPAQSLLAIEQFMNHYENIQNFRP